MRKKQGSFATGENGVVDVGEKGKRTGDLERISAADGSLRKSIHVLVAMTSSQNYEVRLRALEALSCADSATLERCVRQGIHDDDELVRTTAMELAGERVLLALKADVLKQLKLERSKLVRSAAAVALGDMAAADARDVLEQMLSKAGEEERVGFYYALVKIGCYKYLALFLEGLTHRLYRIRCATANLLPNVIDDYSKSLAVHLLEEALKRERTVAARSSLEHAIEDLNSGCLDKKPS